MPQDIAYSFTLDATEVTTALDELTEHALDVPAELREFFLAFVQRFTDFCVIDQRPALGAVVPCFLRLTETGREFVAAVRTGQLQRFYELHRDGS